MVLLKRLRQALKFSANQPETPPVQTTHQEEPLDLDHLASLAETDPAVGHDETPAKAQPAPALEQTPRPNETIAELPVTHETLLELPVQNEPEHNPAHDSEPSLAEGFDHAIDFGVDFDLEDAHGSLATAESDELETQLEGTICRRCWDDETMEVHLQFDTFSGLSICPRCKSSYRQA